MHTRNGYIALVLAIGIMVATLMSPVRITEGFRFIDGTPGLQEQFLSCGSTLDVVRNQLSDEVPGRNTAQTCRGRAITRVVSFGLLAAVLLVFAVFAIRSGPRKAPISLKEGMRPLPESDGGVTAKRDRRSEPPST